MTRRIAIVGLASANLDPLLLAQRRGEDIEVWTANEAERVIPAGLTVNRVFQMHVRDWREAERAYLNGGTLPQRLDPDCFGRNNEHVEYLRTCGVPVYGQREWTDIPTSVVYPFERVRQAVGVSLPPIGDLRLWATSTFGYMIALLLTEGITFPRTQAVSELMLYGIELPLGTQRERLWEWPNLAYYLGMARGMGITVTLPQEGTSLLSGPHYALNGRPYPRDVDHWFATGPAAVIAEGDVIRLGTWREPEEE